MRIVRKLARGRNDELREMCRVFSPTEGTSYFVLKDGVVAPNAYLILECGCNTYKYTSVRQ